ncbi:MAG TPA: ABC transporter substrate-binding protein, partial [Thermoanaerobaculia bacterium]|nr:ABC transporter substrate-binding protein [Thermoanaerobaculia bacterium]
MRLCAAVLLAASPACRRGAAPRPPGMLVPALPPSPRPHSHPRLVSRSIFSAIYEPLVAENDVGVRPALAESWTNPAPDPWLFRIAPDATFHDRSPVTSREVVAAAHASRTARGSVASLADLRAIEVADARTVRFRTFQAPEEFLLSVSALFITRRDADRFVGSGAYRVVAHTPDRIVLARHDRPSRPAPWLYEVVFRRFGRTAE